MTTRDQLGHELKVTLPIETEDPQVIRALRREWHVREIPVFRARNILRNPGFEYNIDGWSGANTGDVGMFSVQHTTERTYSASEGAVKVSGHTSAGDAAVGIGAELLPAPEGDRFGGSCWVYIDSPGATGTKPVVLGYYYYDDALGFVGDYRQTTQHPFNKWSRVPWFVSYSPEGGTQVGTYCMVDQCLTGEVYYFDNYLLMRTLDFEPVDYFDGDYPFAEWEGAPHQSASVLYW